MREPLADHLLASGFLINAHRNPSAPALHVNNQLYSYGDLLRMAEIVFASLDKATPASLTGIYCAHSVWTYASILAVSLSGGCYVPLVPTLPASRLKKMAEHCPLEKILTESSLPFVARAKQVIIDKEKQPEKIERRIAQDLSYILFTSGSTGVPKAVPVSNANVKAFFEHYRERYNFNSSDRFLQPYELSFDVSVFSIFAAWNSGACVYVVPEKGFKYLNILKTVADHRITVSSMVPTLLSYVDRYLDEFKFPELRYSFFAGDRLEHDLAARWQQCAPGASIINSYGLTETTIVCTEYFWNKAQSQEECDYNMVPIGKPFAGMEYLIRSEDGSLQREGKGELCFSGPQVISSYLHGEGEDRFFDHKGKRFFSTGDIISVNAHGNFLFHGRIDSQVKIDGHRVETGEVEHALSESTGQAFVVLPVEEKGSVKLAAFSETRTKESQLNEELSKRLPGYMIPSYYIALEKFPLNSNGKIDRKALKEMFYERHTV
jgi:D-alanine--poly(phosphoribitol) ligase subunit 1